MMKYCDLAEDIVLINNIAKSNNISIEELINDVEDILQDYLETNNV